MSKLVAKNKRKSKSDSLRRMLERTEKMTEAIVTMLEHHVSEERARNPKKGEGDGLFGARDNTISQLQKLVQVIGAIAEQADEAEGDVGEPISQEELRLLRDWLEDSKG